MTNEFVDAAELAWSKYLDDLKSETRMNKEEWKMVEPSENEFLSFGAGFIAGIKWYRNKLGKGPDDD